MDSRHLSLVLLGYVGETDRRPAIKPILKDVHPVMRGRSLSCALTDYQNGVAAK